MPRYTIVAGGTGETAGQTPIADGGGGFNWAIGGYIPVVSGTPSGAPAGAPSGGTQIVFDSAGSKLWVWSGSTWKGIAVA